MLEVVIKTLFAALKSAVMFFKRKGFISKEKMEKKIK